MIVYYTTQDGNFCEKPDPLVGCLFEHLEVETKYVRCPVFQDYIKNIFVVRATNDYELTWDKKEKTLKSNLHNQKYFEDYVNVRNLSTGLFSYDDPKIILFAEKSLEATLLPPFFHNTINRSVVIPGVYDIGKHFRKLECAIQLFDSCKIIINEFDPVYYIKFNTQEKIQFKRFFLNERLKELHKFFINKRNFTKRILPLKWYYENSIGKTILKEIKNNLME
jgi:hypothetical protein